MDTVSIGKHNPRLNDIRKAIDNGTLTDDGLLPVEGPKLIDEARASGLEVPELYIRSDGPTEDLGAGTTVYTVDPQTFKKIQATETSQGAVALVRVRTFAQKDLFSHPKGPLVILAGLQDPGNVGTILRVAESFSAAGCVGLTGTTSLYNAKVVRATAGSIFRLPHLWNVSFDDVVPLLKASNIQLIGTSPHAEMAISVWDWSKPVAILIGNEGNGLNAEQSRRCAAVLRIPQRSRVESLNSAVATGIILYESFRQRGLE